VTVILKHIHTIHLNLWCHSNETLSPSKPNLFIV